MDAEKGEHSMRLLRLIMESKSNGTVAAPLDARLHHQQPQWRHPAERVQPEPPHYGEQKWERVLCMLYRYEGNVQPTAHCAPPGCLAHPTPLASMERSAPLRALSPHGFNVAGVEDIGCDKWEQVLRMLDRWQATKPCDSTRIG